MVWFNSGIQSFLITGLLSVVLSSKVPKFLSKPKKTYIINEGGRVKLKCLVTGSNDPSHNRTLTAWRKEGVEPRNSVIRKSRIWERYKVKNGKYLRIRNVQLEDAGLYWCIAKNQYGMIHAVISLSVKPKPDNTNSTLSFHVSSKSRPKPIKPTVSSKGPRFRSKQTSHHAIKMAKGEELKLSCQAKGNPKPTILWLKDRRPYKRSKNRFKLTTWGLTIKSLRHKDSGVYRCFVWNKFGNITRTFYVQVIDESADPPDNSVQTVIQENSLKNTTALEGETVTFTCAARSEKVPQFAWVKWVSFVESKYEVLNSSSPNVRFVREASNAANGMTYSQKLKLLNVSKSDQGQYTCFVGHDGSKRIVSSHVFLTVRQIKPTVELTEVQGLRENTSAPSYRIGGIEIPLAAIIAVPAALSTLLIVAIIWCYVQTVKHRYERYAKTAAFAHHEESNGYNIYNTNGALKTHHLTINSMERFTILHKTTATQYESRIEEPKSLAEELLETERTSRPEVKIRPEVKPFIVGSKYKDVHRSENDIACCTVSSLALHNRTNRSLPSDLNECNSIKDNSSKTSSTFCPSNCTAESSCGTCVEDDLRTKDCGIQDVRDTLV